jgi:hypothetical protein
VAAIGRNILTEAEMTLPDPNDIEQAVRDALHAVSQAGHVGNLTEEICQQLKRSLTNVSSEIGFAFGRTGPKPKTEREILFDFVATMEENAPGFPDWYTTQALVVAEIEAHGDLGRDFEKLMYTDAILVLFIFKDKIVEHRAIGELEFYSHAAKRRADQVAKRGNVPPIFLIASYSEEKSHFTICKV